LAYGADDLDGTVRHERIHHAAGSKTPEALSIDEIRGLIAETGREPVERDSLYRRVNRESGQWTVGGGQCETSSNVCTRSEPELRNE
jgi:aminodeoxyfutalosine synthase